MPTRHRSHRKAPFRLRRRPTRAPPPRTQTRPRLRRIPPGTGTQEESEMALAIDPGLPLADIGTIKRMIPHRYPFLLIDRVVNIAVNTGAVGIKNVTVN